jgi:hypothetical protein
MAATIAALLLSIAAGAPASSVAGRTVKCAAAPQLRAAAARVPANGAWGHLLPRAHAPYTHSSP